jgi:hypothetical protein
MAEVYGFGGRIHGAEAGWGGREGEAGNGASMRCQWSHGEKIQLYYAGMATGKKKRLNLTLIIEEDQVSVNNTVSV